MQIELKCSNQACGFLEVFKVEKIDPDMFVDDCPECGAKLEKGYDI